MTHQQQTAFENIVGKGEIARNEQFVLFPQCFLLNQMTVFPFVHISDIISSFAAELEEPKIAIRGKGLNDFIIVISQGASKVCHIPHNSLPDDKILYLSKLKAFTDDKLNSIKRIRFFFPEGIENVVRKGENAGYQHFLFFSLCFLKLFLDLQDLLYSFPTQNVPKDNLVKGLIQTIHL